MAACTITPVRPLPKSWHPPTMKDRSPLLPLPLWRLAFGAWPTQPMLDRRVIEVWNSGLTAKVETAPIPGYRVVDGVLDVNGATSEQVSADWMPLLPVVNPLTNPTAASNASNWTRGTVTANVTAGAISQDTSVYDSSPGGFFCWRWYQSLFGV